MKKEQTTWRGKILKTVERHCEGKLTPAELSFLYNTLETQFSQEKEKWLQIIETKREECKKYPLKSMNGSITDKTANDMVDVALLDIINLIQKQ